MRGHSPNITKKVEDVLVFVKGHFPDLKPREIQAYIRLHLKTFDIKENQVPSVRSIQSKMNKPENRSRIERIQNDPLNNLWNIGLGMKRGVSAAIVPVLLLVAKIELDSNQLTYDLTIRKALWLDYLYPTLDEIIKRRRPKLNLEQRGWLAYCIAEEYAKFEELQTIAAPNDSSTGFTLNTEDLDYQFMIKERVSDKDIGDIGAFIRLPEFSRFISKLFENNRMATIGERPLTVQELNPVLENISPKKLDELNKQLKKIAEQFQENGDADRNVGS
jgi:hypothetical protein